MKSPSIYSWNLIGDCTWLMLFECFLFGKILFSSAQWEATEGFWAKGTSPELHGGRVTLVEWEG